MSTLYSLILVLLFCWFVNAFDFVVSSPTSCGEIGFSWIGGTPPFRAIFQVADSTIRNISIPNTTFNGTVGQFGTLLPLNEGQRVAFSMEDATGPITGGTTEVMTVGEGENRNCNTTDPGTDFVFSIQGTLAQCKPYPFTLYSGAVQPITVLVTVPHGESFLLHPPVRDSFDWVANLTAGTSVLLSMTDSQGRLGGTSPLLVVGSSDDESCVRPVPTSSSPTRSIPTPTSSGTSTGTGTGESDSGANDNNRGGSSGSNSTGLIIGAAAGGVVALVIICLLIWFFSRRRNSKNTGKSIDLTYDPNRRNGAESLFLLPDTEQHRPRPFAPYSDAPYMTQGHGILGSNGGNVPIVIGDLGAGTGAMALAGVSATNSHLGMNPNRHEEATQDRRDAKRQEALARQTILTASRTRNSNSTSSYPQSQFGTMPGSSSTSNYNYNSSTGAISSSSSKPGPGAQRPPHNTQPRIIVHTDIEDTAVQEEPIELPPQYSESRAPLAGMPSTTSPQTRKRRI